MNTELKVRKLPPVWFIRIIDGFRKLLLRLNHRMFPASVVLYEHFQYLWFLPCLRVAAGLDIAGLLKPGPKTAEELAKLTDSNPVFLFRMLRALASMGVFRQRKDGRFENTRMSRAMIDGKGSLRYMILQHLGKLNWTSFSELDYSVKTGEDAFSRIYGKTIYEYLSGDHEESSLFDKSMTNLTEISIDPVLNSYKFSGNPVIADIGGGEGLLLSAILANNPGARGILFDRPEALSHSEEMITQYKVRERVEIRSGDFFSEAPGGADIYLLKNVLHNWDDDACIRILGRIRDAMPSGSRIMILEMLIGEDNLPSYGKLIDIQMMVFMKGGRERTRKEFESLLNSAGLKIRRVIPTIAPISWIEVIKI